MAKKKRRVQAKPEEEYEFVPPEFDEKEFILKDLYGTKVLLVVTALAVIVGIVSAIIYDIDHDGYLYLIGIVLMFLVVLGMKEFLKLLKFDPDLLESKSMIGNYVLFLLLSLGVWIVLINPPF